MPTASEVPWPSEPVVASMPGVFRRSVWDGSLVPPSFRVYSHSVGKKPTSARVEYATGPA